jgi:cell wall-associated NlpC family hydrolase
LRSLEDTFSDWPGNRKPDRGRAGNPDRRRRPRVHVTGRLRGLRVRVGLRIVLGCGLLVALALSAALPRWRLDGNPNPPTPGQINSAAGQVKQQQASLGAAQNHLSAASRALDQLQDQAEVLTERYDETLVNQQRAAAAYKVTQARLAAARSAEDTSQQQLAGLAAQEFESGGGFDAVTSMLGDASGPEGYLSEVGMGQVLAQQGTDTLAVSQANDVVAAVFRTQAHDLLAVQQADLRAASALKVAIQAAVARQVQFVRADQAQRSKMATELATAQAHEAALVSARRAYLAAQAAQRAYLAAQAAQRAAAAAAAESSNASPAWSASSGASANQGDIAANWALTQIGKPYQWGGAGPDSYDCSGLAMVAWEQAGVQLAHYTGYQWESGPEVPLDQLQRGDLVFYATDTSDPGTIHHVGIYIGNGQMVDAPYTGAYVRIDSIYQPGLMDAAIDPAG